MTYLFLDTMVLLHFKPLSDIPWEDLFEDSEIELRITRGVIRELDRHKNAPSSSKIRERARRVLRNIELWADSPKGHGIRRHVHVRIHYGLPNEGLRDHDLNESWPDDVLIATVLDFQLPDPGDRIFLVTDDTGARIHARHLGLQVFAPPDEFRLPLEKDPLEVENEQLKQKMLKISAPPTAELSLEFADGHSFAKFSLPDPADQTEDQGEFKSRVEAARSQYRPIESKIEANLAGFAPGEVQRYNRGLPEFYKKYEAYQLDLQKFQRGRQLTYEFTLQVVNKGRAPANDIDVHLHFPDGFSVVQSSVLATSPVPPKPPRRPRTEMELLAEHLQSTPMPISSSGLLGSGLGLTGLPGNVSEPTIKQSNSHDVDYTIGTLKHGYVSKLGSLALVFERADLVRSFEATFSIDAANIPDDSTGTLRFVFEDSGSA